MLLTGCTSIRKSAPHKFNTVFYPDLQPMITMNNSIGAISTYNYNYLCSRIIPTIPIPKTRFEYQQLKKLKGY